MMAAVQAGRKTVTRRRFSPDLPLQQQPERYRYARLEREGAVFDDLRTDAMSGLPPIPCPFGQPGERLQVLEDPALILEIRSIWAEQVQCMTEADALAEGVRRAEIEGHMQWGGVEPDAESPSQFKWYSNPLTAFQALLDSIYPTAWARNEWVWVVTFVRCSKPANEAS